MILALRPRKLWLALAFGAALLGEGPTAPAQSGPTIALPAYGDAYSRTVRQLEAGQTDIDYRKFRESFLDSAQLKAASERSTEFKALRTRLRELTRGSNPAEIVEVAKQMLGIDYTNAWRPTGSSSNILGDTGRQKKYPAIELDL